MPTVRGTASLGSRAQGKAARWVFPHRTRQRLHGGPTPKVRLSPLETLDNGCVILIAAGASGTPSSFRVTMERK